MNEINEITIFKLQLLDRKVFKYSLVLTDLLDDKIYEIRVFLDQYLIGNRNYKKLLYLDLIDSRGIYNFVFRSNLLDRAEAML